MSQQNPNVLVPMSDWIKIQYTEKKIEEKAKVLASDMNAEDYAARCRELEHLEKRLRSEECMRRVEEDRHRESVEREAKTLIRATFNAYEVRDISDLKDFCRFYKSYFGFRFCVSRFRASDFAELRKNCDLEAENAKLVEENKALKERFVRLKKGVCFGRKAKKK